MSLDQKKRYPYCPDPTCKEFLPTNAVIERHSEMKHFSLVTSEKQLRYCKTCHWEDEPMDGSHCKTCGGFRYLNWQEKE